MAKKKVKVVKIGDKSLSLKDFNNIVYHKVPVLLSEEGMKKVEDSHNFLTQFAKDKIIYGINTGFGPMAQYKIQDTDQIQLQYNLIRSHAMGCGDLMPAVCVRALMVSRLNTVMLGYSGVHKSVVRLLAEFLNFDITPHIYEHGGVGASGDLVQLAHLGLNLIGEGEVDYNGVTRPTAEVMKELNLEPIEIKGREGLSIINGTSAMSGIGVTNILKAKNLLNWSLLASSTIIQLVKSYDDHFSFELNNSKRHKGQRKIAGAMRKIMESSQLIRRRDEHLYDKKVEEEIFKDKVQEYYSLRCIPQILGPVLDTIKNAEKVIIAEVNSASDNPIIDVEKQNVYHGGNFHGDYVALEMDKLKIAITKVSMLAERQLNFLLNDKLNNILPPFVNMGKLGFNFGLQGAQFTATSTVAENQTLSNPMYIHSIPNNNDNQDVVSMGTNAALMTRRVLDNAYQVLAIEWMAILQAIDILDVEDKLSDMSKEAYTNLRKITSKVLMDTPRYKEISTLKSYLLMHKIELIKK